MIKVLSKASFFKTLIWHLVEIHVLCWALQRIQRIISYNFSCKCLGNFKL